MRCKLTRLQLRQILYRGQTTCLHTRYAALSLLADDQTSYLIALAMCIVGVTLMHWVRQLESGDTKPAVLFVRIDRMHCIL